ncbi:MAG: phosphoadenosine phosphosulfate reductase family protein [Clostridia bacterium]|nr:phosphoadenosine phosphosulfate reductase family protein [Clostridia bacterium]
MIKYTCNNCKGLECETSICPVCHQRAQISKSEIYWCEKCNIPNYEIKCPLCNKEGKYIGTDIRPVFAEERLLLEILKNEHFKYAGQSIWNTSGNNYIANGKKVKFSIKESLDKVNPEEIRKEIEKQKEKNEQYVKEFYEQEYIKKFIQSNKIRLNYIMNEAIEYIRKQTKKYKDDEMFVSFSGGKDSTVTSDIVMKALGRENIIHIYGDTTLEYPTTGMYLTRFKEKHKQTPMLVAKNKEQDFNELCKVIGPPSRMMRWCCTIFKTGAITRKIDTTFKDKKNILTFQGIRRNESTARNKYERESENSKIAKQIAVSPIIDWTEFDIWLYILSNKIDFNDAYRQGFARVGCWCCPNNSSWSEFLSSIYMPKMHKEFKEILIEFAKSIGKPDPIEYVKEGGWKARQGGNGLEFSKNAIVEFKPCALTENTINFELTKQINETLYELFKPFGIINYTIGNKRLNEVYVLNKKTNEPILKIIGKKGQKTLKISILKFIGPLKDMKTAEILIKNQITKFQTCIGCLACESNCKYNAIKISNIGTKEEIEYKINEDKCVGCLECVKHFSGGCFMKKVLRTKIGE